jgi:hypothetical protein
LVQVQISVERGVSQVSVPTEVHRSLSRLSSAPRQEPPRPAQSWPQVPPLVVALKLHDVAVWEQRM